MKHEIIDKQSSEIRDTVVLAYNLIYRLAKIASQNISAKEINFANHLLLTRELEIIWFNNKEVTFRK